MASIPFLSGLAPKIKDKIHLAWDFRSHGMGWEWDFTY